jgi:hypothetical protein
LSQNKEIKKQTVSSDVLVDISNLKYSWEEKNDMTRRGY